MPKVSRATASHATLPGYVDTYEQMIGDWTVSIERFFTDMDFAPFYKGAPDDMCQASHMGYILDGKFSVRRADGVEETFEAGDVFVVGPGHIPIVHEGLEYVAFTPTREAKEQAAVIMPNMMKYAEEHGIQLPAEMMAS